MKAKDIRKSFLSYFKERKDFHHICVESSSLVPASDRSVLFSIAGMQQFKPYFLGDPNQAKKDIGAPRATSVQKCFRVNDIDEIGDSTHLTFFEMLGNFSFNDYFKEKAIEFALDYVLHTLHLDQTKIWVTYFGGDSEKNLPADVETKNLWIKSGIHEKNIIPRTSKDNLWGPPGATGPCGPSTEIYYPFPGMGPDVFDESKLIEIWNIVFMQYEKDVKGDYRELKTKNIDTGMGLERISMIVEKKLSVFETSLFKGITESIVSDKAFSQHVTDDVRRLRIAADHFRSSIFLLSDGVSFGKKEQQAVLRRIFRKALDQYSQNNADVKSVLEAVIEEYHHQYPNLKKKKNEILQALLHEQHMYQLVRERKVAQYLKKISPHKFVFAQTENLQGPSSRALDSNEAFLLLTTYGFSLEQLKKEGYTFNEQEILTLIAQHKSKSKEGAQRKFGGHGLDTVHSNEISGEDRQSITKLHTATHLLHAALRKILGNSVQQQGSDINPERLRFDFTFERKLTESEKNEIELVVNDVIKKDFVVKKETLPLQKALDSGALAFFREKYPDPVTVYTVYDRGTQEVFSRELCGGPHVSSTKEIGTFNIISEKSVAQGIRRIKASVS